MHNIEKNPSWFPEVETILQILLSDKTILYDKFNVSSIDQIQYVEITRKYSDGGPATHGCSKIACPMRLANVDR